MTAKNAQEHARKITNCTGFSSTPNIDAVDRISSAYKQRSTASVSIKSRSREPTAVPTTDRTSTQIYESMSRILKGEESLVANM